MFTSDQYELIDFGNGRRLERMGVLVLDRPCPAVKGIRQSNPNLWKGADVRFLERRTPMRGDGASDSLGTRGVWRPMTSVGSRYFVPKDKHDSSQNKGDYELLSRSWTLPFSDKFVFELKGSPFGHVGVFPEQAENWIRIEELCRTGNRLLEHPIRVLNLFGYTGGSALAAAFAKADVTHLDAARNVVAQAKRNAAASFSWNGNNVKDCDDDQTNRWGTIRWIVDDAVKFVKREEKRGSIYHGIILDPPSYGHGARGEVWRFARDIEPLLERCMNLLSVDYNFILLSCHTPNFKYPTLGKILHQAYRKRFDDSYKTTLLTKSLGITSCSGAVLPAGDMALVMCQNNI